MKRITAFLIAAFLLIVPAHAAGTTRVELDAVYFQDPVHAGLLQTSVAWGDVRVRTHASDAVSVSATITTDRNGPALTEREIRDAVDLEFASRGNVLELRIDSRLDGFYGTDLEILVPRDSRLNLEVRRGGNIFVHGVAGEVEVSNRNGSVELEELGSGAVVHARNGSITAGFERVDPRLPLAFSTLNGSVDVTLPREIAADLLIRYNKGGVESDFPIDERDGASVAVDTAGLEARETRIVEGRINGGGPRYRFETANGTVYLRRGK